MFESANTIRRRAAGVCAGLSLAMLLAGCCGMSQNETTGTVLGGAAGAVLGSQFGKGTAKNVATAIGAVLGATVGREIGVSLDETSRRQAGEATHRALETSDVGTRITWEILPTQARRPRGRPWSLAKARTNKAGHAENSSRRSRSEAKRSSPMERRVVTTIGIGS